MDPLQAFVGSDVDNHRANAVRPIMTHLKNLAEEYQCAILIIEHMNKAMSGKAMYRGNGSIDFSAAVRSILMIGTHRADKEQKGVALIKAIKG